MSNFDPRQVRYSLQIWKLAADVLMELLRTADRGWSCSSWTEWSCYQLFSENNVMGYEVLHKALW
jgi:hypothetical protein